MERERERERERESERHFEFFRSEEIPKKNVSDTRIATTAMRKNFCIPNVPSSHAELARILSAHSAGREVGGAEHYTAPLEREMRIHIATRKKEDFAVDGGNGTLSSLESNEPSLDRPPFLAQVTFPTVPIPDIKQSWDVRKRSHHISRLNMKGNEACEVDGRIRICGHIQGKRKEKREKRWRCSKSCSSCLCSDHVFFEAAVCGGILFRPRGKCQVILIRGTGLADGRTD